MNAILYLILFTIQLKIQDRKVSKFPSNSWYWDSSVPRIQIVFIVPVLQPLILL